MRQPPVVIAAEVHVEQIDAGLDEVLHIIEGVRDRAAVLEVFKRLDGLHAVAVGLVEREAEVDAVHDGIAGAGAAADLGDEVDAEALPVGVLAHLAAVEGRARELVEQITLVAVQIHAVDAHGLGVHRGLAGVLDDLAALEVRQRTAGHVGQIEVGVPRGRDRQLRLGQKALGVAHAAEARGELDEDAAAAGVHALGQIAPAHEVRARAVDAREVGVVALLGDGGVDAVADGNEAGRQKTDAALGAGEEILQHLVVRTAGFLGHLAVAHRRHDNAVFHGEAVDADGREQLVIGIERLRHAARAAGAVFAALLLEPVAIVIDQILNQFIFFQDRFLAFHCFLLDCGTEWILSGPVRGIF